MFSGKDYASLPSEAVLINLLGILVVVFGGLVIFLASNPSFKRQPLPEDSILLTGHDE